MKVAIVTPTFPPYPGGIGRFAYHHAIGLGSLGHEVEVFSPLYDQKNKNLENKLKVSFLKPMFSYGNAAYVPSLSKKIKGFDIIHLHYPFFGGAEVVWRQAKKLKKRGTKIIIHYHMDVVGRGWIGLIFKLHRMFLLNSIIKVADRVIVTSMDYARSSDIGSLMTANPKKFVAIPIGVDSINFQPKPKNKSLLEKYGISKDSKVIIFVGALDKAHYFKGVENLITAVASLRDVTYEWHLLVVGAGELLSSYRDLASQLHLSGRISFAGYVPDKDLADHFNLAELAILPSIDKSEAFGTVLLEAMSCGKSVIGSDLPGVRTVVEHEINGLVVKPGNPDDIAKKINVLFQDDSLRNRFGQAGRKKVLELYDWAKVVSQIDKIYQQVKV